MKILYINTVLTHPRIRVPGSDCRVIDPPYDGLIDVIKPDYVIREPRSSKRAPIWWDPLGVGMQALMKGEDYYNCLGRPLERDDHLYFVTLPHLFHHLFEDCLNRFVELRKIGLTVTFYDEDLTWDFTNDVERARIQFEMMTKMQSFVSFKETVLKARYQK